MKATIFFRVGATDVRSVVDVPDRMPSDGEAWVRVEAASIIDPSDLKNVSGAMSQTTLPHIRDFADVVETSTSRRKF